MKNIEKYKDVVLENLNNCHLEKSLREVYGKTVVCCPNTKCDECKKRLREWLLEEYKEPILTDAEKDYLSAVIKPFRKKVMYISKLKSFNKRMEYLSIDFFDEDDIMYFPYFEKNTMYKGMKDLKEYTPEELGL